MKTNISKFKNLKRSDFKNLLDFTDDHFKKAFRILIEEKVNDKTDLQEVKQLLNNLKTLEIFYLLDLCIPLSNYQNIEFLLLLFFNNDYEIFNDKISQNLESKFKNLKNETLTQSRQKKPLFKKEIVFKLFLSANLKNIHAIYKNILHKRLVKIEIKKEYKFIYELYYNLNKALNAKVPYFSINIERFRNKDVAETELNIFTKFWEKIFPELYKNNSTDRSFKLIFGQYIFRDYFFNRRETLMIDIIADTNYITVFRELDTINKEWKHALCLYLYELHNMYYIKAKSKDEIIYFLSVIFNRFNGFSFSSIELNILKYRDGTIEVSEKWKNFIKNDVKNSELLMIQ